MTPPVSSILIRECGELDELGACVRLQSEVWGFRESEVVPRRTFVVARSIGGQVVGAFDTSRPGTDPKGESRSLVGFAMALPGIADGQPYLHSHMLGVHCDYRNRGIGRRLKLFQRQDALARGIRRMEWTFDPLEIKNSFLNIAKLGVIVRRYAVNLYGVSSSGLQGGLPTDRLYAEWWMASERVKSVVDGVLVSQPPPEETVTVPCAVSLWKQSPQEQERALEAQQEIRQRLERAFSAGLAILGFAMDAEGNGVFKLGRWREANEN